MTVSEALILVRRVGTAQVFGDKLKLRFPDGERAALQIAIETLRSGKAEALLLLAEVPRPIAEERHFVWMDWYEWKAAALNRVLQKQGVLRQSGRISAATVRHGEGKGRRVIRA